MTWYDSSREAGISESNGGIYSKIYGTIASENIEIEIERDMIRMWDIENNRPLTDEQNETLPTVFSDVNRDRFDLMYKI